MSCPSDPSYWVPEGQHALPGNELVTDGNRMWGGQPVSVFKAEPGTNASIVVSYRRLIADSSLNLAVRPLFKMESPIDGGLRQALSAPSWLSIPSNSTVFVHSGVEHVDVTVTFAASKDAPLSEHLFYLVVEKTGADSSQNASCSSGYSEFFLKVAMDKKATATTTETTTAVAVLTSTYTTVFPTTITRITSVTSTEQVEDPLFLAWALGATTLAVIISIFIILVKYGSGKLKPGVK
ncbi:MAG: hypothetical protein M1503_12495 [Thaumarchaeota archaeon]|nr:hypothetical protein [Nitrososphaerota archaeon]MCL5319059.1 hypothetical protein [Nitrososphaerota archaeon]